MKSIHDKDVLMVQDKNQKHKYYIMLDGYVIGVEYKFGA